MMEKFTKGCIKMEKLTTSEIAEQISTCGFMLGVYSGYKEVAEELYQIAGTLYAQKKDSEALQVRNIAEKIENKSKVKRHDYDTNYKELRSDLFEELDLRKTNTSH